MDRGDTEEHEGMRFEGGKCTEPCLFFVPNHLTFALFLCCDRPLFERLIRLNEGVSRGTDVDNVFV
jgi:hypothetical protein